MAMTREEHEEILNQLLNPELEQSQRTELLQSLRVDYGTVLAETLDLNNRNEKLTADNNDLIISNSKLFRQIGITTETKKEEEEKDFSETITLENLGI